ncbi:unknown [Crocosphaera subtropica ATCC 51142]|uniref:DUF2993 domain-containing protein n=1 Tax=Crocosphaera subtropica (strain ATCC 51142 / BH68) TaxID=43989 RepID=B1WTZ4_CROS5|nr:DUF2993 domain-containing protein [Crocosphaera subtropica]ACB50460.1 unknown [Crocosphaera subtropica ATCC 51142]
MLGTESLGEQTLNTIAKLALSSQLKDCDHLDVTIKTSPEKIVNGEVESLLIEGKGLVIETDLRVESLEIAMKEIAIDPLKALTGNIELTQPTVGTAHLTLTQTDLNRAFNSRDLRNKINVLDTYLSRGETKVTVPEKRCKLYENGTVAVETLIQLQPSGETKEVAFTTTPKIAKGGRSIMLKDIDYAVGKEVSEDLTEAFLEVAKKMLNLSHFEKQGLALRINHLNIDADKITLSAAADITQFPTL